MNVAANFVRFNPQTGEKTQTYTLGASMKFMPHATVGVNYARNDGPGHPSIINVSAIYEMSKTMNLYAAFNRATDGVSSSYSAIGDAAADPTLTQTGTSNAVIIGLQKGF
jgi:predicted porin